MSKSARTASPSGERNHKLSRPVADDAGAAAGKESMSHPTPPVSVPLELDLLLYERAALQPDDG